MTAHPTGADRWNDRDAGDGGYIGVPISGGTSLPDATTGTASATNDIPDAGSCIPAGEDGETSEPARPTDAETDDHAIVIRDDDRVVEAGDHLPDVAYDKGAFPPLASAPSLGDPGHQRAVVAMAGPLTPGVPDTTVDFLTAAPFEIRAVSTRGWSHRQRGVPRQDACAIAMS